MQLSKLPRAAARTFCLYSAPHDTTHATTVAMAMVAPPTPDAFARSPWVILADHDCLHLVLDLVDDEDEFVVSLTCKPFREHLLKLGAARKPVPIRAVTKTMGRFLWVRSLGLDAPQWLNCWDKHTCAVLAGAGALSQLQKARELGCPWDGETCTAAARKGHIFVLEWARAAKCDWDPYRCSIVSAAAGHLQVLQWIFANGGEAFVRGRKVRLAAQRSGERETLKWLESIFNPTVFVFDFFDDTMIFLIMR